MNKTFSFTQELIERLPVPMTGRNEYKDAKVKELRLRVTSTGIKSFSVYKRLNGGKAVRVTLGRFPYLTVAVVRRKAQKCLGDFAVGVNPNAVNKKIEIEGITLNQALERYIKMRRLSPRTIRDYRSLLKCQLSSISKSKLVEIEFEDVARIHKEENSPARADYSMRMLRAIFNFMNTESINSFGKSIFLENPVRILSHRKQWNNVQRKQGHIRLNELPAFAEALQEIRKKETVTGQSICDSLLFALLTGLRCSEILGLKWKNVNLAGEYFTIYDRKNGEELELPITPYIHSIFELRKTCDSTEYVFSSTNKYGQIRTPRKVVNKVLELSATNCKYHDCRRTFATTAEHLDIGSYKLKRLMGHMSNRNDVTAGYLVLTAETLRESSKKIQDQIVCGMNYFPTS